MREKIRPPGQKSAASEVSAQSHPDQQVAPIERYVQSVSTRDADFGLQSPARRLKGERAPAIPLVTMRHFRALMRHT